jgi:N-acetylornithine carbamoyltransferase
MPHEPRHLLGSLDLSPAGFGALVARAHAIRAGARPDFAGRVGALLFFQPSVRTRLSMESALARYGGAAVAMTPGAETWQFAHEPGEVMDGASQEHVRELGPVLSRLSDLIGVRRAERIGGAGAGASYAELAQDLFLTRLAACAEKPVLNLESNRWHPLQGLADRMLLEQRFERPAGRRYVLSWAFHPRALPAATPHSQLLAACDLGMDAVLLCPPGYELEPKVLAAGRARARAQGGELSVSHDPRAALSGAEVVCVKSWGRLDRYGEPERESAEKTPLREPWLFSGRQLALTRQAFVMHCLPVRRNVVIADEVLDSPHSAVIDQAENRLWTAAAAIEWALGLAPAVGPAALRTS